jgi:hypothetical protein
VTEATVRRALLRQLQTDLPDALPLRHEDQFTKGIPDLSISYAGHTSWWECKYADPYCKTTKVQQYLCEQLNTRGFHCAFLIFRRGHNGKWPRQIRVCPPADFSHWRQLGLVVSEGAFDYGALVQYIRKVHTS